MDHFWYRLVFMTNSKCGSVAYILAYKAWSTKIKIIKFGNKFCISEEEYQNL